jgi:CRISPR/Cas system CSM-associated protein Csm3 (group 7 of RAMP superfamily)
MNPYDFVPIDWTRSPVRKPASLHDRFYGVSGKIEGTITAETPVFIFHSPKRNSGAEPFIRNKQNQHIIPGSSLKGLFRNLVETIGNGCFLLFDGNYKKDDRDRERRLNYHRKLPDIFKKCDTADLCIACRMFGITQDSNQDSNLLLLGKVSFNDAVEIKICEHPAIYTISLMEPKPRHQAFYLDQTSKHIAGRKFYFHQPDGIQTEHKKSGYNQHITPIDKGSQFAFSVQFTNLEDIELQTLLYALVLESQMRHKLGYGKPAGLGSVRFDITKLTLIDYANRYTANQGTTIYDQSALASYLSGQKRGFTSNTTSSTLNALCRLWRWNPNGTTTYRYPNQAWFNTNPTTPISGTS